MITYIYSLWLGKGMENKKVVLNIGMKKMKWQKSTEETLKNYKALMAEADKK